MAQTIAKRSVGERARNLTLAALILVIFVGAAEPFCIASPYSGLFLKPTLGNSLIERAIDW